MPSRKLIVQGQKTALATMEEDDQPFFYRWLERNPKLRALIDDEKIPTMDDQRQWFARSQKPDRLFFSIVTLPDERLIGNAGFVDLDRHLGTALLRITIGDTSMHGQGHGTEAVQLLLKHAFEDVHLKSVQLRVLASNPRAVRTYEKVGFTERDRTMHKSGTEELHMEIDSATFFAHQ